MFNVDNDINAKKYDKSVIMFCSNTCNPCKITVRTISEIEKENVKLAFFKVTVDNSDECRELAISYNVNTLPTVVFLESGKVKKIHAGIIHNKDKFKNICKEVYGNDFEI